MRLRSARVEKAPRQGVALGRQDASGRVRASSSATASASAPAAAIDAAANPADGPWFCYVTVNLRTGETKFTDDYDEFLGFKRELDEYCATQSDRC